MKEWVRREGKDTAGRKCPERRVKIIMLAGLLRGRCVVCVGGGAWNVVVEGVGGWRVI